MNLMCAWLLMVLPFASIITLEVGKLEQFRNHQWGVRLASEIGVSPTLLVFGEIWALAFTMFRVLPKCGLPLLTKVFFNPLSVLWLYFSHSSVLILFIWRHLPTLPPSIGWFSAPRCPHSTNVKICTPPPLRMSLSQYNNDFWMVPCQKKKLHIKLVY